MPDQTRNLNSVTDFAGTLDSNDRIIMTDNKASLKALTTAILGKAMIEGYTGSSLAGSSQSVKSAIDVLNSKTKAYDYVQSTGNFLDWVLSTFTVNGEYFVVYATGNAEGWATSSLGSCMVQKRNGDYFLTAYINDTATPNLQAIYVNRYVNSRWIGWIKLPTRSEMDAVTSKCENLLSFSGTSYNDLIDFCKANPWKIVLWTVSGKDATNFPTNSNRHYGFATMNASEEYGTILCMNFNNSFYSRSTQGSGWSEWVSVI